MIEKDIQKLVDRDSGFDLRRLEADVWKREVDVSAAQRAKRSLAFCQTVVMVFAVLGSAAAGISTARSAASTHPSNLLASGEELAPSSLLFGAHR